MAVIEVDVIEGFYCIIYHTKGPLWYTTSTKTCSNVYDFVKYLELQQVLGGPTIVNITGQQHHDKHTWSEATADVSVDVIFALKTQGSFQVWKNLNLDCWDLFKM